jgi:hypothetical protein
LQTHGFYNKGKILLFLKKKKQKDFYFWGCIDRRASFIKWLLAGTMFWPEWMFTRLCLTRNLMKTSFIHPVPPPVAQNATD